MKSIHRDYIEEITLLTMEEAKKLPKWILANGSWWWLRSFGGYPYYVAGVCYDGTIDFCGLGICCSSVCVRPVLKIRDLDLKAPRYGVEIGETVRILGRVAYYIGNNKVLLCESIGTHRFDENTNRYENSEIKKFLEDWLGIVK